LAVYVQDGGVVPAGIGRGSRKRRPAAMAKQPADAARAAARAAEPAPADRPSGAWPGEAVWPKPRRRQNGGRGLPIKSPDKKPGLNMPGTICGMCPQRTGAFLPPAAPRQCELIHRWAKRSGQPGCRARCRRHHRCATGAQAATAKQCSPRPWSTMLRHKQRLCRFDMCGAKPTIAVARFRQTLSHGTECPWISYSAISPFSESTSNGGCRFSGG
jgi:hypothetical protein